MSAYSLELAWRFLRGSRGSILGTSSAVAVGGLAVGSAALVVAMGLMTGYRRDLADSLVAVNAEVLVFRSDSRPIENPADLRTGVVDVNGVEGTAGSILQPGFAASEANTEGIAVTIKGIDPREGLPRSLAVRAPELLAIRPGASGELPLAFAGQRLAQTLGLTPGQPFSVSIADLGADSLRPRSASFRLAGTFSTGFTQYDQEWIFTSRQALARASNLPANAITALEVRLQPGARLDRVLTELAVRLPPQLRLVDWRSFNRGLFQALALQQAALFVALGLIVGVAAFNLAATLHTLSTGRTREIGLLQALGARPRFVATIFLFAGACLGIVGTAIGLGGGWLICRLLTATRAVSFPPGLAEVYFVAWIPFRPAAIDMAAIAVVAITLSIVAAVAPARRAARIPAAAALRYE